MREHTDGDRFWQVARGHVAAGRAIEGTMMGSRCLRVGGQFAGMVHSGTGEIIVKLPRTRVQALVADGVAEPFAPNGRVFREWALLPQPTDVVLTTLVAEAVAFAGGAA